jgi:predicted lipoprotein with Yx(FWY)xxD motif
MPVDPMPIADGPSNLGDVFVAKAFASVLVSDTGSLSVVQQNKTNMTLYVFDADAPGSSACSSPTCITNWPPLIADSNASPVAPFTLITRGDGNKQWALRDKPLYFFIGDTQPGDIKGDGVNNAWHVAGYAPVATNRTSQNAADGDYLIAVGKPPVGMPLNGGNTDFAAQYLDRDGYSLYFFDPDTTNQSNCSGNCLVAWPPLLADEGDEAEAPYSIITRSMGGTATARQWAYQGRPLYFYVGDTAAGQTNGKNIPNWHLARRLPVISVNSATYGSILAAYGAVKTATEVGGVEQINNAARHEFSLYTFDNDVAGTSNCTGTCLNNWPALMADEGAVAVAPYSLVARAGGKFQWALDGMPLYFFAGDTQAGETKGEGVGGKWHLARVAPVAVMEHPTKGKLFIAQGNLVNQSGGSDAAHQGLTLYTFDADPLGSTTCFGGCLTVWPALYAAAGARAAGDFTIVVRDQNTGVRQWAYKGKPLYFYLGDTAVGDVNGEYKDWTIARP